MPPKIPIVFMLSKWIAAVLAPGTRSTKNNRALKERAARNSTASNRRYPTSPAGGPCAAGRGGSPPRYLCLEAGPALRCDATRAPHRQAALAARQCPCLAGTFAPAQIGRASYRDDGEVHTPDSQSALAPA